MNSAAEFREQTGLPARNWPRLVKILGVAAAGGGRHYVERMRPAGAGAAFQPRPAVLRQIHCGALLHDIGKIAIPDAILLKPGALTPEESAVTRTHPKTGYRVVSKIPEMGAAAEIIQIILSHPERHDRAGYPHGLAVEAFIAEEATLGERVNLKCGLALDAAKSLGVSATAASDH